VFSIVILWPLLVVVAELAYAWRLLFVVRSVAEDRAESPLTLGVEIVIPAHNEAGTLPDLLNSLSTQRGVHYTTTVIDDRSSDDTGGIAASLGARVIRIERRLGNNPKAGALSAWTPLPGSAIVVFCDADVKLVDPGAINRLVQLAVKHPHDLISVQPFHRMQRVWEQAAFFPNLVSLIASGAFLPVHDGRSKATFGPVLCCHVDRYRAVGGHASVVDAVLDDQALGTRFRAHGGATLLLAGFRWIEFRMYPKSFAQLVEGFRKNVANGATTVRGPGAVVAILIVVGEFSAIANLVGGVGDVRLVAGLVLASMCCTNSVIARRIGTFRWWSVVAQLVYLLIFLWIVLTSCVDVIRGRTTWKGQTMRTRS
jgi:4,4'-diaponeurosporenoate glycosyltransferase